VNPANWVQVDWATVDWVPFLNVMFWWVYCCSAAMRVWGAGRVL